MIEVHGGKMKLLCCIWLFAWGVTRCWAVNLNLPDLAQTKMAAEAGDAAAQYRLGLAYQSVIDYFNAEAWFYKSAVQGFADAQYSLGSLWLMSVSYQQNGRGTTRKAKPAEAVDWLTKAAAQGHHPAMQVLADCYRDGSGVDQDYAEAYKWYNLALKRGNATTQQLLNPLILKMSSEQIADGQKRVEAILAKEKAAPAVSTKPALGPNAAQAQR